MHNERQIFLKCKQCSKEYANKLNIIHVNTNTHTNTHKYTHTHTQTHTLTHTHKKNNVCILRFKVMKAQFTLSTNLRTVCRTWPKKLSTFSFKKKVLCFFSYKVLKYLFNQSYTKYISQFLQLVEEKKSWHQTHRCLHSIFFLGGGGEGRGHVRLRITESKIWIIENFQRKC